MRTSIVSLVLVVLSYMPGLANASTETKPVPFVVQLTRSDDVHGHRRVMLQLDRILEEIGEDKVKFVVVAYEEGITALLADNEETSQLVTKLVNRGVTFKVCRISMQAWELTDDMFPLEMEYVPAGAPEVIRLQMQGYKYWKP